MPRLDAGAPSPAGQIARRSRRPTHRAASAERRRSVSPWIAAVARQPARLGACRRDQARCSWSSPVPAAIASASSRSVHGSGSPRRATSGRGPRAATPRLGGDARGSPGLPCAGRGGVVPAPLVELRARPVADQCRAPTSRGRARRSRRCRRRGTVGDAHSRPATGVAPRFEVRAATCSSRSPSSARARLRSSFAMPPGAPPGASAAPTLLRACARISVSPSRSASAIARVAPLDAPSLVGAGIRSCARL